MIENIVALIVGSILLILGFVNISGKVSTVHWYHRTRVSEEDKGKYGKWMGAAAFIIGLGIIIPSILHIIFSSDYLHIITLVSLVIGLSLICYAQIKYNKGLF